MKAKYIQTIDFTFEKVEIINVKTEKELIEKIEEGKVIIVSNWGATEYINSNYIMCLELEE